MKNLVLIIFCCLFYAGLAKENPGKKQNTIPAAMPVALCSPPTAFAELNINNVRVSVAASADMWWDLINAKYEVPINSGKHSMFAGSLWIGGVDSQGQIKVAGQTYRQTGIDFWSGAMDTTITDITSTRCNDYDRHWKVNKQDVIDFVASGTTTPDIISWPGNGSGASNEGYFLAPFFDNNGDEFYNYLDGDYPGYNLAPTYPTFNGTSLGICNNYLFGDANIWWVINDVGNVHTETGSLPIGLEIRCQAFAFQSTLPSINNSTFYKYQVINRSSNQLNQTYFGQWADPDLGNATDDYVGCDVGRGLGYCYNGDINDDGATGYGIDPPAIGIDFLQGPYADLMDAIDNDNDGCVDCTFIDSAGITVAYPDVIIPEGIAMAKFVYYNNINNSPTGNPNGFADFYNYLKGIWLDNQPISYGGDGRNISNPVCNYMFPGNTDPLNFPTLGIWSEATAGNFPADRRFIQSAGAFTLAPGAVHYVTTGVVWARQTGGGPLGSVALLQQYDDDVQQLFTQCFRLQGVGISETETPIELNVFPNPASDVVIFQIKNPTSEHTLTIYNSAGSVILKTNINNSGNLNWDTSNLPKGNYLYKLLDRNNNSSSGKVLVY